MEDAALNLAAILGFFFVDLIYRQVLVRESGYVALDLALFALLDSGFTLLHDWRADDKINGADSLKVVLAFVFYSCLVTIYTNLQRKQARQIERTFNAFQEALTDVQEHTLVLDAPTEVHEGTIGHHKAQRNEVNWVREIAEETIWINVFLAKPRPRKLERAEELVRLLDLVIDEVSVPAEDRIKGEDLYLKRSPLVAIAAAAATVLTVVAAVWPT